MEDVFASCQMYRHKPVTVRAFQAPVQMDIGGLFSASPGDWVIIEEGGQKTRMTNEEFHAQYERDPATEVKIERKRRRSSRKQHGLAPGAGLESNGSALPDPMYA